MNKKHNSHYILGLLAALVVIFFIIIGTDYFQSRYIIDRADYSETSQSYADGKITANPFVADIDGNKIVTEPTKKFGNDVFEFTYPSKYALSIIDAQTVEIIPQIIQVPENCSNYTDEQERALCINPKRSPDVRISLILSRENEVPENYDKRKDILIAGTPWNQITHQGEYGGSVWYQRVLDDNRVIDISYTYADVEGGLSYETLQEEYGNQYLLSAAAQNQLTLDIIKSLVVK